MGFWDWKYTASDLADWFDNEIDDYWRQQDEWLIEQHRLGNAHPVIVFASWAGNYISTAPKRAMDSMSQGVVDILRLGCDLDFESPWGTVKGIALNVMRLAAVAEPIAEAPKAAARHVGILAASRLTTIKNAVGPCQFVAFNNAMSLLKGKRHQIFAALDDIVRVGGSNEGIQTFTLLQHPEVAEVLRKFGVTWKNVPGLKSVDDVLRHAQNADGPVNFVIKWVDDAGEMEAHAVVATRDAAGNLRILDYWEGKGAAFKGFKNWAEYVADRKSWGAGLKNATLSTSNPPIEYSSNYLRVLHMADGSFKFALPVAMGVKWAGASSLDDAALDVIKSVWRYLKAKLKDKDIPPPVPSTQPVATSPAPAVPATPDDGGPGVGVTPVVPEASGAPRIDWLTGIQYRLKYLGYYAGAVHGQNDPATKDAVRAFQKDWFSNSREWDAIPGPKTQAMLYSVLGW